MVFKIYCLSFNNQERKISMKQKFKDLDVNYTFYDGVDFTDPRITTDLYKKCWSCMYGHLDMIKMFYDDPNVEYGIFCEDDIYIHKDFNTFMPDVIKDFKNMNLDVLLLGYLVTFKIDPCYHGFSVKKSNDKNLTYHDFTNDVWGTQMYMLSKINAKRLLDKYGEESDYAPKSLHDPSMTPFSADWTITKDGNRALITPCLAVENGKVEVAHFGGSYEQYFFHKKCHEVQYDPDIFI